MSISLASVKWTLTMGTVLTLAVLAMGACGDIVIEVVDEDAPTETRDDTFDIGPSARLVVSGFNGRIVVNGNSGETVRVQATLRWPDKIDYQVTRDGGTVTVKAEQKSRIARTSGQSPGADIEVTVPARTGVRLHTANGRIEVRNVQESGEVDTTNGKIVLLNVKGDFDAETTNGSIEVEGLEGTVVLKTTNGGITFAGELEPGSKNELRTANGGVTVNLEGEPSVVLDASTSNGSVTSKLPILATSTGDNHLTGTIGDGAAGLLIRTANASITVQ